MGGAPFPMPFSCTSSSLALTACSTTLRDCKNQRLRWETRPMRCEGLGGDLRGPWIGLGASVRCWTRVSSENDAAFSLLSDEITAALGTFLFNRRLRFRTRRDVWLLHAIGCGPYTVDK